MEKEAQGGGGGLRPEPPLPPAHSPPMPPQTLQSLFCGPRPADPPGRPPLFERQPEAEKLRLEAAMPFLGSGEPGARWGPGGGSGDPGTDPGRRRGRQPHYHSAPGGAGRGAQSPLTLTPPCPTGLSGYSKAPALLGAYGRPPVPEYPWGWGPYVPGALPLPASKLPAALYPPPFYPPLPPPPPPPPAAAAAPPLPGPGPGPERPLEPGSDSELEVTDGGGGGSSGDEAGSPPPPPLLPPPPPPPPAGRGKGPARS